MLRVIPSLLLVVVAVTLLLLSSFSLAEVTNQKKKDLKQQRPIIDDCNAFPWKDKSKAPALLPGMSLGPSQSIQSSQARLILQPSGDLQLLRIKTNKILWNTNTKGATKATFDNGNLFLQDDLGTTLWTTNVTLSASANPILQIQHDCNLVIYTQSAFMGEAWSTGTSVCLVAHIVPHSHDDVGWLLTPERYYDGCQSQGGGVQGIISTSLECLAENPNRTYTQVESYFFQRWWIRQNASTQAMVKKLVENGQLDFTNGGWSMHDEACVHQESAIANMEVGANFLKETFGDALKLKIGWHIDPFGHASTTPRIMAQMGFDAFFFWRQDNQQRQYDMNRKGFESMWRSSTTLDGSYNMFTSIMYEDYCQGCNPNNLDQYCPGAFCCMNCEVMEEEQASIDEKNAHGFKTHDSFGDFEAHTHADPSKIHAHRKHLEERRQKTMQERTPNLKAKQQDRTSLLELFAQHFLKPEMARQRTEMKNVYKLLGIKNGGGSKAQLDRSGQALNTFSMDYLADEYANLIRNYAGGFRTNNVLIPWGCDFRHNFAFEDYPIMDAVIEAINSNPDKYGMELIYSSPRKYVNAVAELENDVWPSNNYDYFVYADGDHNMWSGYFTSRAEYKGYERWLMANHRAAETVYALNTSVTQFNVAFDALYQYRQAMGLAQHHDSITGTERTHVRNQYQYILDNAYQGAQQIFQNDIKSQIGLDVQSCPLANLSICAETSSLANGQPVEIVLWNNIMQTRSDVVTIPIPVKNVHVMEIGTGTPLQSQVVDTWRITKTVDVTSPQTAPAQDYQVYIALEMPPQSYKTIRIIPSPSADNYVPTSSKFVASIQNEYYKLSFDSSTNAVNGVSNLNTGVSSGLNQMIAHYCPHSNIWSDGSSQASGAYIFRTCQPNEDPVNYMNSSSTAIPTQWVLGPLCMEVRQVIDTSSNIQQAWRLCKGFDYVELTNGLGELNAGPNGVEVIQRLSVPNMKTDQTWYTDSEGLELQQRILNKRPNYPYTVNEPISSNFFPCNAFATINQSSSSSTSNGDDLSMGIVMDRSRAMASLHDGQLEMLIHRRLLFDDGRGVGQALDARTRVLSTSRLIFHEPKDSFMEKVRLHSLRHTHYPQWFVASHSSSSKFLSSILIPQQKKMQPIAPAGSLLRGLASDPLPPNVHRHALTYLWNQALIVRVQHMFDRSEGPLSTTATVKLQNILPPNIAFNPQNYNIVETDILGVNELSKMGRNAFNTCMKDGTTVYTNPPQQDYVGGSPKDVTGSIILRPMEIRTFVVTQKKQ